MWAQGSLGARDQDPGWSWREADCERCPWAGCRLLKRHFAEKPSKALNVLNIVFGALSVEINLVGAIVALIANGQEDRRAALEQKE